MNKNKAFTLVEMLIVMGIMIILMGIGIAAGRFAIQRANRVQHQDAANQLDQGLQGYYSDNKSYPSLTTFGAWSTVLTSGVLSTQIDVKSFSGGGDASYYYTVDSTGQYYLICVSLGGQNDASSLGGYCDGNGFGKLPSAAPAATLALGKQTMTATDFNTMVRSFATGAAGNFIVGQWSSSTSSF